MASVIGKIAVSLTAQTAAFFTGMNKASKGIRRFSRGVVQAGGHMLTLGTIAATAVTAGLVKATMEGVKFQKAMAEVSTIIQTNERGIAVLTDRILKLSRDSAKGPEELAKALYQTVSAGVASTDAMKFLEQSTRAATAGVATVTEAVDLTTTVVNAYGMKLDDVGRIHDVVFKSIEKGKTTMSELSQAIGGVAPFASQLNIRIEELFGSMATLTKGGIDTANAATFMKNTLAAVLKPSTDTLKAAKKLGIEFSAAALRSKGLVRFLEEIKDKTAGSSEAITKLFPNIRGLTAVMALVGKQSEEFKSITDALTNSLGASDIAYNKIASTSAFKYEKSLNRLTVVLVKLGTKILPLVVEKLEMIADTLETVDLEGAVDGIAMAADAASFAWNSLGTVIQGVLSGISGVIEGVLWLTEHMFGEPPKGSKITEWRKFFGTLGSGYIKDMKNSADQAGKAWDGFWNGPSPAGPGKKKDKKKEIDTFGGAIVNVATEAGDMMAKMFAPNIQAAKAAVAGRPPALAKRATAAQFRSRDISRIALRGTSGMRRTRDVQQTKDQTAHQLLRTIARNTGRGGFPE